MSRVLFTKIIMVSLIVILLLASLSIGLVLIDMMLVMMLGGVEVPTSIYNPFGFTILVLSMVSFVWITTLLVYRLKRL